MMRNSTDLASPKNQSTPKNERNKNNNDDTDSPTDANNNKMLDDILAGARRNTRVEEEDKHITVPLTTRQRIVTLSLNHDGTVLALGGKQVIFVELSSGKELHKGSNNSFDTNVILWNQIKRDHLATSCNTDAIVYNFDGTKGHILSRLSFHKRAVMDLSWNFQEENTLATCAPDGMVAVWDVRDNKKPTHCLSISSGLAPTKVRWNRIISTTLATANGDKFNLWDTRKPNSPLETVFAHVSAINGLDWSHRNKNEILTHSQDRTVKFWRTDNKTESRQTLNVGAPVLYASYCPFGRAIATVTKNDNSVKLWNTIDPTLPVHTFNPPEALCQLEWTLTTGEDGPRHKLLSLTRGGHIELWTVNKSVQKACRGVPPPIRTRSNEGILDLAQEFALMKKHGVTGVKVNELNLEMRMCRVRVDVGEQYIDLEVNFPAHYPHNAIPFFRPMESSTLSVQVLTNLRKMLMETAQQLTGRNRPCLEECLNKMVLLLKSRPLSDLTGNALPTDISTNQEKQVNPGISTYIVKATDTLSGLALKHKMSTDQIKQSNQLFSNQIYPGMVLYLKESNSNATTQDIIDFKRARSRRSSSNSPQNPRPAVPTEGENQNGGNNSNSQESREEEPRKSLDMGRFVASKMNKEAEKEEIIKETVRYCGDEFRGGVHGDMTLTSSVVIFEPNLDDNTVMQNGILPYQLVLSVKDIFDVQMINEDQRYHYDDILELSVLNDGEIKIYDFLMGDKEMTKIYKYLIKYTSSTMNQYEQLPVVQKQKEKREESTGHIPELHGETSLLANPKHRERLSKRLPGRYRYNDWKLLFSTQVHGVSLKTFYNRTENAGPSLLVVEDDKGGVFGAFASDSWRVEPRFYGTGETFVFTLEPQLEIYDWSEKNRNFMCSRQNFIAVGAGPMFSIWLNDDFYNGSTHPCETFCSPMLSTKEDFQISVVEVWGVA
ncbi:hypothetical protein PROFUN_07832 [Planoprotostelium fungivorum]|uniref:Uncharacterized protein n=1 Tax=Planoprotostelium fungivorum TaxID=1890364 RepID=A0A2P6NL90_9EUKA|nr:hypothetical protein PROFUN_07832 [Planoprotostelium fungivorum]